MKKYLSLLTILFVILFAAPSAMSMELSDNKPGNDLNSESVARQTQQATYYLAGPYIVSSITRTNSSTLYATFTSGDTYTSTYTARQSTLCTALATYSYVYLYMSDSTTVVGILALTY